MLFWDLLHDLSLSCCNCTVFHIKPIVNYPIRIIILQLSHLAISVVGVLQTVVLAFEITVVGETQAREVLTLR